jgi:hypothetical protein
LKNDRTDFLFYLFIFLRGGGGQNSDEEPTRETKKKGKEMPRNTNLFHGSLDERVDIVLVLAHDGLVPAPQLSKHHPPPKTK